MEQAWGTIHGGLVCMRDAKECHAR
jgi:hypothetical protein